MTPTGILMIVPALLGLAAASAGSSMQVTRTIIQEQLIVRVPVQPRALPHVEWVEHKGPKCLPTEDIRGASLAGTEHVDFTLADRSRIRAEFDGDCHALDFYRGFYLKPEGAELCAQRDSVHSRVGGSCRIERFRRLTPKP